MGKIWRMVIVNLRKMMLKQGTLYWGNCGLFIPGAKLPKQSDEFIVPRELPVSTKMPTPAPPVYSVFGLWFCLQNATSVKLTAWQWLEPRPSHFSNFFGKNPYLWKERVTARKRGHTIIFFFMSSENIDSLTMQCARCWPVHIISFYTAYHAAHRHLLQGHWARPRVPLQTLCLSQRGLQRTREGWDGVPHEMQPQRLLGPLANLPASCAHF